MKKAIIITIIISIVSIISIALILKRQKIKFIQNNIETIAMVHKKEFLFQGSDGEINQLFLKGVNVGATIPGTFPGELAITKATYLRWFELIYEMNANVIRVYTTMKPDFYEALAEFNANKVEPLYLLQGVWINENSISTLSDAYASNGQIINEFIQDTVDLVDIFHGNKTLPERLGFASGIYTADVSKYVIGWVLGIEWSPDFVIGTNEANPNKNTYVGEYIYTNNASPFEVFLAEVGDTVLRYEATNYLMTRPLSFTNWLTTDLLTHRNEPDSKEDMVSVNTENIKTTKKAFAGMFASYHIYPYYPEFMNYETKYQEWIDPATNEPNPYKAYLIDLIDKHSVPVLVAEFGLPSSRGITHENPTNGYNQGGHTEAEQGQMVAELYRSIEETDAIGALIFSWQDEWFKRTWNTMDFDLSWRRPFWSNVETNEQFFGLLAFDPGEEVIEHHVDGDISEWSGQDIISNNGNISISVDSDYRYLYLMIQSDVIDLNNKEIYIPIDTIPNQGNDAWPDAGVVFDAQADFVIKISGENDSKIVVDRYYDSTEYLYAEVLDLINSPLVERTKNTGIFQPITHVLSAEFTLPETGTKIPFSMYEAGKLRYGNSNPDSSNYDSLADYYFGESFVEIRIPWLLLNVMDPSTKQIISDFNTGNQTEFTSEMTSGFNIGLTFIDDQQWVNLSSHLYDWESWDVVIYHERLKASYRILQEVLEKSR
ncbi:MAG: family 2 glycosyl transferase [Tenericutes bacterium HGW-Tenericutes-1]|nr:MAG: family 2 glycosyl transferase [Tenericutes bacterium HGW-Tenericutes-1]